MNFGLLLDHRRIEKETFAGKIKKAAEFYVAKFGHMPTMCQVSPLDYEESLAVEGIKIEAHTYIRPWTLWIGTEKDIENAPAY